MGYYEPETVVAVVCDHDFDLVEGTDKDYIIWCAPTAGAVTEAWTSVDAANMGGTLKVTLQNRGVGGTATAVAVALHADTDAWSNGSPDSMTVTAVQLEDDDYLDVKLECQATTNTVTVNRLVVGFNFVSGARTVSEG